MTTRTPDVPARLAARALVGFALTSLASKRSRLAGALSFAALGLIAHQMLDEPVAKMLSRTGL